MDGARRDASRVDPDAGVLPDGARPPDAARSDDGGVVTDACVPTGTASDVCNGADDDCDGIVDEDEAVRACGVGMHCRNRCVGGAFAAECENVDVPGSPEVCGNGDDDNCDGTVDEMCECTPGMSRACGPCANGLQLCAAGAWGGCMGGTSPATYHRDADSDGFGNAAESMMLCTPVAGWVVDATDCNDACSSCTPFGFEVCDGNDNDCDGAPDDGAGTPWYPDADRDGFGATAGAVLACGPPGASWSAMAGDCNDACARCRPGYPGELCGDMVDNNCNGLTDEIGCPCDIHTLATGTYLYCRSQTWAGGRAICMSFGGDLAVIESGAENAAVFAAMSPYGVRLWYGATDAGTEGTWIWVDRMPMSTCAGAACTCAPGSYCNWHSGEPSAGAPDDCLVVNPTWPADWGDYLCSSVLSAVCELPAPAVAAL